MKIDALVLEIGSTTTLVNAFTDLQTMKPRFLGGGISKTTVLEGDVTIGVEKAITNLKKNLGISNLEYNEIFATSSAAGGLKMTVHGLVHDMTVKAAYEAAIGAGANIHFVSSGKLRRSDLTKIKDIKPNIILIAGGVDYGERDTALYNIDKVLDLDLNIPIIYAGNIENHDEIKMLFKTRSKLPYLKIVNNVYPNLDQLDIIPSRKVIHQTFEENIMYAKGMEKIFDMVNMHVIPTPGAVMESTNLLYEEIGDLLCFDVGGATTDLHSVTEGSEEYKKVSLSIEPVSKRTVEGDLGVFVNFKEVLKHFKNSDLLKRLDIDELTFSTLINNHSQIPKSDLEKKFVYELAKKCVDISLNRHAGIVKNSYTSSGVKKIIDGKDLTNCKYIVATGGALTNIVNSKKLLSTLNEFNKGNKLFPRNNTKVLVDKYYVMASIGVLSLKYKEASIKLLKESLSIGD